MYIGINKQKIKPLTQLLLLLLLLLLTANGYVPGGSVLQYTKNTK
jgi:hypothetical protein